MGCSPSGSSVHRILQARILEWVAMPSSRGTFWPKCWSCISKVSCFGRQALYHWRHWGSPREWVAIPFSTGSSQSRDWTWVSWTAGKFFTIWANREVLGNRIIVGKGKCESRSVVSNSLWPHGLQPTRLFCPWNSPGQNTGVGSHSLLQGIFPTQESNRVSCKQILYQLCYQDAL